MTKPCLWFVTNEKWVPLAAALCRQCFLNLALQIKEHWRAKTHASGTQSQRWTPPKRNINSKKTSQITIVSSSQLRPPESGRERELREGATDQAAASNSIISFSKWRVYWSPVMVPGDPPV